jgi:putative Mg2+ transporter-C (MgtC) family protein
MDFSAVEQLDIVLRVAISLVLGALIGLDREFAEKPAGLRTHMLVAGAAALLVGQAEVMVIQFNAATTGQLIESDPIRVIGAIITGVSFLGAGTIIRRGGRGEVEGLTTAASLLFAAGIGICVGLWQLLVAVGSVVLVLFTLRGVDRIAARILNGRHP